LKKLHLEKSVQFEKHRVQEWIATACFGFCHR